MQWQPGEAGSARRIAPRTGEPRSPCIFGITGADGRVID